MGSFEVQGAAGEGMRGVCVWGRAGHCHQFKSPFWSATVSSIFPLPALSRRGDLSCLLQPMQQIQYRLILHLS